VGKLPAQEGAADEVPINYPFAAADVNYFVTIQQHAISVPLRRAQMEQLPAQTCEYTS
jgi:hypothetical protein